MAEPTPIDVEPPAVPGRLVNRAQALLGRFVEPGALLLSILTLGSYAMGLVRDRTFARTFGAGAELDAYNAAFVIPELLFDVLIAGGLAAPFVPVFTKLRAEDRGAADDFGRTVLTMGVVVMAAVSGILFLLAPLTADAVAPGFGPQQRALYADLFRVMCVTPLLFTASIALGEILVADRRFLFYGLAPLLYNGGIVAGTVVLAGRIGIFAPAVGAVLGAALHLAIRLLGVARSGFPLRPRLAVRTAAVREFVRLMAPRTASAPIEPLTFQFFTYVASGLVAGSITSVSFARNFQSVPVSLVGAAFSLAAFPALSVAAARGDRATFVDVLGRNLAAVGLLTVAAGAGLFVLSTAVIEILLGGGKFDPEDVRRTALLLSIFALSVPLESLTYPLARAIYATRNTLLPVGASIAGFGATVITTLALEPALGVSAIPAGFVVGSATKAVLLAAALPSRLRRIEALGRERLGAAG